MNINLPVVTEKATTMSNLPQVVQTIHTTPGVQSIVVLDNRGIVRAQAGEKNEKKLVDYISFIAVTSTQIRTYLSTSVPHNARVSLSNGQTLLILFGEDVTVGILLEEDTEYHNIIENFASIINELKL